MKKYPGEYICKKCNKLNHEFLRCLCWAKDDSDWPHESKHYDYSFVSTCTLEVQWITDEEVPELWKCSSSNDSWGYSIDYIPETIVMDQNNPFQHTIWTPEGVAYNLQHAIRVICRGTETPQWNRYHVFSCGNIDQECDCCCGDPVEEEKFHTKEEMKDLIP